MMSFIIDEKENFDDAGMIRVLLKKSYAGGVKGSKRVLAVANMFGLG